MRGDGAAPRAAGGAGARPDGRRQSAAEEVGRPRRLLPARVQVVEARLKIAIVVIGLIPQKVRFVF